MSSERFLLVELQSMKYEWTVSVCDAHVSDLSAALEHSEIPGPEVWNVLLAWIRRQNQRKLSRHLQTVRRVRTFVVCAVLHNVEKVNLRQKYCRELLPHRLLLSVTWSQHKKNQSHGHKQSPRGFSVLSDLLWTANVSNIARPHVLSTPVTWRHHAVCQTVKPPSRTAPRANDIICVCRTLWTVSDVLDQVHGVTDDVTHCDRHLKRDKVLKYYFCYFIYIYIYITHVKVQD